MTKEDVVAAVEAKKSAPAAAAKPAAPAAAAPIFAEGDRVEKRVPMTRLRAKVAERLVEAQPDLMMTPDYARKLPSVEPREQLHPALAGTSLS